MPGSRQRRRRRRRRQRREREGPNRNDYYTKTTVAAAAAIVIFVVVAVDVVEYSQRTLQPRAMQSAAIYIVAPRRRRSTTADASRPPTFRQRCPPPRVGCGSVTAAKRTMDRGGAVLHPTFPPRNDPLSSSTSLPLPHIHSRVQGVRGAKNDDDDYYCAGLQGNRVEWLDTAAGDRCVRARRIDPFGPSLI